MTKDKGFTNVGVPAGVNERFSKWCERRHVIKRDALGAMLDRFLKLPAAVQTAFIDVVDDGMEGKYATMLRWLADQVEPSPVGPQPTRSVKPGPTRNLTSSGEILDRPPDLSAAGTAGSTLEV